MKNFLIKNDNASGMFIITTSCRQCNKEMLVALVGNELGDFDYGPEGFSDLEIKLAEQHGVLLKVVSSKTAEEAYLANVCKECGAFVGKWFFFAHYYTQALYGYLKYKKY